MGCLRVGVVLTGKHRAVALRGSIMDVDNITPNTRIVEKWDGRSKKVRQCRAIMALGLTAELQRLNSDKVLVAFADLFQPEIAWL